jgi:hypothetical protein
MAELRCGLARWQMGSVATSGRSKLTDHTKPLPIKAEEFVACV